MLWVFVIFGNVCKDSYMKLHNTGINWVIFHTRQSFMLFQMFLFHFLHCHVCIMCVHDVFLLCHVCSWCFLTLSCVYHVCIMCVHEACIIKTMVMTFLPNQTLFDNVENQITCKWHPSCRSVANDTHNRVHLFLTKLLCNLKIKNYLSCLGLSVTFSDNCAKICYVKN